MTFEALREPMSQPTVAIAGVTGISVDLDRRSAVGRVIDWHRAHEDRIAAQRASYQPPVTAAAPSSQTEAR